MKHASIAVLLTAALALPLAAADRTPIEYKQVLSQSYIVDRKYKSMEGPSSMQRVYLGDPNKPELMWIVGVKTEMVGPDGKTPQLPELMCHVNVDLDPVKHQMLFNLKRATSTRLVTLSQGMLSAELPRGYGFPIASNEPLILFTQVLNHNIENPGKLQVRHRVTFEYVRDRDLKQPLKPLFNLGASGMVLLGGEHSQHAGMAGMAGMASMPVTAAAADTNPNATSCLLLPRAPNANAKGADYIDPEGRKMTGHWVVPPGHQENHSDVTWFMNLPYNTTLHFAAVHLHPFASSLSLRDTTTGETLFTAKAVRPRKGIGLAHVDSLSSERGVPLFKDHKYEVVSVYDNPTRENSDSMASIFLGLEDPEFVRPDSQTLATRAMTYSATSADSVVLLRTSAGDVALSMLRDQAPHTVKQFLQLVLAGVYNGAKVTKVDDNGIRIETAALTDAQKKLIFNIPAEGTMKHEPGVLSICGSDPTVTIMLATDAARDGKCTPFAKVGPGAQVLRAIRSAGTDAKGAPKTPVTIKSMDVYANATDAVATMAAK